MKIVLMIFMLLHGHAIFAAVEVRQFDNPQMEQQYHSLINELRCLVCQNQNLADSNAELAQDLRQQVYEMLRSGQSEQDVINFMVQRYGDFVLYRPRLKTTTVLLWVGPFVLLVVALGVLLRRIKRNSDAGQQALNKTEQEKIRRMLDEDAS